MLNRLKILRSNQIVSNTLWIVSERVFQLLISLVLNLITVRYLGPNNYGLINYVGSYIAFFTSICTLGLEGIIIKELLENPLEEGRILGSGIFLRILSSFVSSIAIVVIIYLLNPDDIFIVTIAILQSISLVFRSFELIDFWYQSKLKSKYTTIIKISSYLVMSAYKVIILILHKDVRWFAFSTSLDIIVASGLMYYFYRKHSGPKLRINKLTCISLIRQSYHFIFSGLMVSIYAQTDKIMLGTMLNQYYVGIYAAALTVMNLWNFIPMAIITSLRPKVMELKNIDDLSYIKALTKLYSIIIWLSIIYSLFITIFSKYIILIMYGKDYIECIPILIIIVWGSIFSLIGCARDIWIISEGKQKYSKWFAIMGAFTNLFLNLILIPKYGLYGATIATLITQITTGFIVTLVFKETRVNNKYLINALLFRF